MACRTCGIVECVERDGKDCLERAQRKLNGIADGIPRTATENATHAKRIADALAEMAPDLSVLAVVARTVTGELRFMSLPGCDVPHVVGCLEMYKIALSSDMFRANAGLAHGATMPAMPPPPGARRS